MAEALLAPPQKALVILGFSSTAAERVYTVARRNRQNHFPSLDDATASIFHQRDIGRVLRSPGNYPRPGDVSSHDRDFRPG